MLKEVHPKLPMRNKKITEDFYVKSLEFIKIGDYTNYLIFRKDSVEIHFFLFPEIDIKENYGQIYIRVEDIFSYFEILPEATKRLVKSPPEMKPWGKIEFSLLDPDNNLLTFGSL